MSAAAEGRRETRDAARLRLGRHAASPVARLVKEAEA